MRLTARQSEVLATISKHEMWVGEVAAAIGLPFHRLENVRPALNQLVQFGLATSRQHSDGTSRRILYAITAAGRAALKGGKDE